MVMYNLVFLSRGQYSRISSRTRATYCKRLELIKLIVAFLKDSSRVDASGEVLAGVSIIQVPSKYSDPSNRVC
jgi:hypothetical protein